ncbi:trypsin-like peptidase domain-containing protein [Actinokineospora sp. G85]|uniref:trypsin-like peptidase domain-containing protein n=1 Tax=Actinokineospora sp. G85 TaxID=3406626 RepID=UPI003C74DDA5
MRARSAADAEGMAWRVRVLSVRGRVLGAGVLLGTERVLTCAHVLGGETEVDVDLMGHEDRPRTRATLGAHEPAHPDHRGDVAVLRLREPQPPGYGARLRRSATPRGRAARAAGYPATMENGVVARVRVTVQSGVEWLQLDAVDALGVRVQPGFSGAGVQDAETGDVLGIVVSHHTDPALGLAWMASTDTVLRYLPEVEPHVVGGSGFDRGFTDAPGDDERAEDFLAALRRLGLDPAVIVVFGPDVAVVRRAVTLSLSRSGTGGDAPVVDLAVDVAGRTADEVARRVVDRAGLAVAPTTTAVRRLGAGAPALTAVLDGVDAAADPVDLLRTVVGPLVDAGSRVVLGFSDVETRTDAPAMAEVRALRGRAVALRASALEALVGPGDVAFALVRELAATDPGKADRYLRKLRRSLPGVVRDPFADDLRYLDAVRMEVVELGLAEDPDLGGLHRRAHAALTERTADHTAARAALREFEAAVLARKEEGAR